MTIIQNIAFGLAYLIGIPVISVGCVALIYYINGQKSKLNFRLRGGGTDERPTKPTDTKDESK